MRLIYEVGDYVELLNDWRLWKKGDIAEVVSLEGEKGVPDAYVELRAINNKKAEKDANLLHGYRVKPATPKMIEEEAKIWAEKIITETPLDHKRLMQELLYTGQIRIKF